MSTVYYLNIDVCVRPFQMSLIFLKRKFVSNCGVLLQEKNFVRHMSSFITRKEFRLKYKQTVQKVIHSCLISFIILTPKDLKYY